jgi:hypothetical protein
MQNFDAEAALGVRTMSAMMLEYCVAQDESKGRVWISAVKFVLHGVSCLAWSAPSAPVDLLGTRHDREMPRSPRITSYLPWVELSE